MVDNNILIQKSTMIVKNERAIQEVYDVDMGVSLWVAFLFLAIFRNLALVHTVWCQKECTKSQNKSEP